MTEETKRRIQIREVIRAHLDKERELFAQGIKVLSLFFIDEVAKYRDYDREDTLGDYARIFEEEYAAIVEEILGELELDAATTAYQEYLRRDRGPSRTPGLLLDRQEDQAAGRSSGRPAAERKRASPTTSTPTT